MPQPSAELLEYDPPTPTMRRALAQEQYAECRAVGHAWERYNDPEVRAKYGVVISFRCMRGCTVARHDIVKRMNGELLDRWYAYPDDYKLNVEEQMDKSQWRKVYVKQISAGTVPMRDVNGRALNGHKKRRKAA